MVEETGAQHRNTEDGQGLWKYKKGAGDSAGAGGTGEERWSCALKDEQEHPHWGREGGHAYKRELLGQRCSAEEAHGLFRRG